MKKILAGILGVAAFAGLVFAFSNTVTAGGGPHLTITNSNGSWEVREGSRYSFKVTALPESADMQVIYMYVDGDFVKQCTDTSSCSYTISSVTRGEHTIYAIGYDYNGRSYELNTANQTQKFTGRSESSSDISSVTLTRKGEARVGSSGRSGIFLEARARGTNLSTLKITRSDDSTKTVSVSCARMERTCSLGIYPTFSASDVGKTYYYYAVATDASGQVKSSEKISVQVLNANGGSTNPNPSGRNPTLSLLPNGSEISTDQKLTIRGNASNSNGIWGMEVRALPSWTNTAITKRCILNNQPTSGSCSMDIGNFPGRSGQSVKVWVIYWDAKTGLGYSSEQKTIRIAGTNTNDDRDEELTVAITAPRFISDDERVTFTARTHMDDGEEIRSHVADVIRIYVNGRLARTCYDTSVCSYVGGPFGQVITHRPDRVSYYATAEYGDQFDSIPVQYSYIDYTN